VRKELGRNQIVHETLRPDTTMTNERETQLLINAVTGHLKF
jgi:hypothetical protein